MLMTGMKQQKSGKTMGWPRAELPPGPELARLLADWPVILPDEVPDDGYTLLARSDLASHALPRTAAAKECVDVSWAMLFAMRQGRVTEVRPVPLIVDLCAIADDGALHVGGYFPDGVEAGWSVCFWWLAGDGALLPPERGRYGVEGAAFWAVFALPQTQSMDLGDGLLVVRILDTSCGIGPLG